MKQKTRRLGALLTALVLTLGLLCSTALAAGSESYEGIPVFSLAVVDEENGGGFWSTAFVAGDPQTGDLFLIGSDYIQYCVEEEGMHAYLLGDDDYLEEVEVRGTACGVSLLQAAGLESPMYFELAAQPSAAGEELTVGWRELEEEGASDVQSGSITLDASWEEQQDGGFISTSLFYESMDDMAYLGAILLSDHGVVGSMGMGAEMAFTVVPLYAGMLPSKYAIGSIGGGSDTTQEPSAEPAQPREEPPAAPAAQTQQPTQSEEQTSSHDGLWILVGVAIGAVAFYVIKNGRKSSKDADAEVKSESFEFSVTDESGFDTPITPEPVAYAAPPAPAVAASAPFAVRDAQGLTHHSGGADSMSFGRNAACGVRIPQSCTTVSGSHCMLYREGGKLYLMDTGSTNGTFFSEQERLRPHEPYRIRKGMAFYLSERSNTFVVTAE